MDHLDIQLHCVLASPRCLRQISLGEHCIVTLFDVQCLRQISLGEDCFVTLYIIPSTRCPNSFLLTNKHNPLTDLPP